ncbi:MAG: phosphoglycerate kinase [Alphaproteobacteria bacterium]|nr:phosphoglycerate kinase [Alphaproteobacteria bacterium]
MKTIDTLNHINLQGMRVLVRADLNVPVQEGKILDTTRIERLVPTLKELIAKKARIIILSHFGRPEGRVNREDSLQQVCPALSKVLGHKVKFISCLPSEAQAAAQKLEDGQVALLENLRFHPGEEQDDDVFAQDLAKLGDLYVNDAFSVSHRAHASVHAITKYLPAIAGRLMQAEIKALTSALKNPQHPVIAIVGGAKVSTKLAILKNLIKKVDILVVGGGMANTFLFSDGIEIGTSLCENDMIETVRAIQYEAQIAATRIILPQDVVVAKKMQPPIEGQNWNISCMPTDTMIVDIGSQTILLINQALKNAKTCIWNGPLGVFEVPPFDQGTIAVMQQVASLTKSHELYSIAGGGETIAALNHAGCSDKFSYISTAGGAFLEWLEGKTLPGLAALEKA